MESPRAARWLDTAKLPVVDLSLDGREISSALRRACAEVGFFYVRGHGVSQDLVDAVFEQSRRFHDLSLEEKERLRINAFHRGYIGRASYRLSPELSPNLSESLVLMHELAADDPDRLAGRPLQGPNQWPEIPGFRETTLAYVREMERVGRRLLRGFASALDLAEEFFLPLFERPTTFLRMLHYPPQPPNTPENQFGSAPHTDYGAITILAQDATGGLHVRHRDEGWVEATPISGTFVVNLGDVMARWTNERFVSTPHRVLNVSSADRYSIPFFFDPNLDAAIECLPSCEGPRRPAKHAPIRYGDYLLSRLDAHYAYRNAGAESPG